MRKLDNKELTDMHADSPLTPEVIMVPANTDEVKCDGGGGALGHPVVWYAFGKREHVDCHYCDRRFLKK